MGNKVYEYHTRRMHMYRKILSMCWVLATLRRLFISTMELSKKSTLISQIWTFTTEAAQISAGCEAFEFDTKWSWDLDVFLIFAQSLIL